MPLQGEVMNVEAAPAAVGAAAPMIVPSEPVSIVVDEKLMVVLNKDGGVESMEVNGGMALQVCCEESMQIKARVIPSDWSAFGYVHYMQPYYVMTTCTAVV